MKRTTAPGHQSNLYTEGNPSLTIPATVVGADEMNNIQEELCNAIEHVGITLNAADHFQLKQAIQAYVAAGGASQINQTINNNQTGAANITGLTFAGGVGGEFLFHIHRKTDSFNYAELGRGYVFKNLETLAWGISYDSKGDDADVDLFVDSSGQVQYKSSNLAGTNYVSVMRITGVVKISN